MLPASGCWRVPGKQSLLLHTLDPKSLNVIGSRTDKDSLGILDFYTKTFIHKNRLPLVFSRELARS